MYETGVVNVTENMLLALIAHTRKQTLFCFLILGVYVLRIIICLSKGTLKRSAVCVRPRLYRAGTENKSYCQAKAEGS